MCDYKTCGGYTIEQVTDLHHRTGNRQGTIQHTKHRNKYIHSTAHIQGSQIGSTVSQLP